MTLDSEDIKAIEAIVAAAVLKIGIGVPTIASKTTDADVSGTLLALDVARRPLPERRAYFDNLALQQKTGLSGRRSNRAGGGQ